jgi:hypothetical protein
MIICLFIAMFTSGMTAALLFAVVYVAPSQYLTLLIIATPIVAVLVIAFGGPAYVVLQSLRIRLSLLVCSITGALIGAVPGLILWATSASPSIVWSATEELRAAAWHPLVFSLFGCVGGAVFANLLKWIK